MIWSSDVQTFCLLGQNHSVEFTHSHRKLDILKGKICFVKRIFFVLRFFAPTSCSSRSNLITIELQLMLHKIFTIAANEPWAALWKRLIYSDMQREMVKKFFIKCYRRRFSCRCAPVAKWRFECFASSCDIFYLRSYSEVFM